MDDALPHWKRPGCGIAEISGYAWEYSVQHKNADARAVDSFSALCELVLGIGAIGHTQDSLLSIAYIVYQVTGAVIQ